MASLCRGRATLHPHDLHATQVHVLVSAGLLTCWQAAHPAFMQQLQQCRPSLACQALEELHQQGSRLQDAAKRLQRVLEDLAAAGFTPDNAAFDSPVFDDQGRLFKVSLTCARFH